MAGRDWQRKIKKPGMWRELPRRPRLIRKAVQDPGLTRKLSLRLPWRPENALRLIRQSRCRQSYSIQKVKLADGRIHANGRIHVDSRIHVDGRNR